MKKRDWGNLGLHMGVALALAFAMVWENWLIVPATFIYTWLREQAQHRWILTKAMGGEEPGSLNLFAVDKQSFFGWMTWHRMFEVFQWTAGSAVGVGVGKWLSF